MQLALYAEASGVGACAFAALAMFHARDSHALADDGVRQDVLIDAFEDDRLAAMHDRLAAMHAGISVNRWFR
jgi:hypothetical protein